jgi:tetratricopeptide (TPR) repeat protein
LQKYQTLRPSDPNGPLALGIANFRVDDDNAAIPWLKKAASYPSTAAEAHYYLGRVEQSQDHLDEAETEFTEALRSSPDQPNTLAELGRVAFLQRNYTEAASFLDRALKIDPDNYLANYALMQLYARTKDARREQQEKRFNQVKDNQDQQDSLSRRLFEIRRDDNSPAEKLPGTPQGDSGDTAQPAVKR